MMCGGSTRAGQKPGKCWTEFFFLDRVLPFGPRNVSGLGIDKMLANTRHHVQRGLFVDASIGLPMGV
jgi:hypothetical protein